MADISAQGPMQPGAPASAKRKALQAMLKKQLSSRKTPAKQAGMKKVPSNAESSFSGS